MNTTELKILIIDDDEIDRINCKRLLDKSAQQYQIVEAINGTEGLSLCHSAKPDCIILDYFLPDFNGIEFLNKIRTQQDDECPPIVVLTGHGDERIAVEAMKLGAYDYILKNDLGTGKLEKVLLNAIEQHSQARQNEDKRAAFEHLAMHDPLTQLANRLAFTNNLEHTIAHASRHHRIFALLMIDLDHFKQVNDSYGHPVGDELLIQVAARMKESIRQDDYLARLGGDEFAILLTEVNDENDAGKVAQKIINILNEPFQINEHQANIGCSIGIACFPKATSAADDLIKCADVALYRVKEDGRNNFEYYNKQMNQIHQQRTVIDKELREAIRRNELLLHFIPIYNLQTEQIDNIDVSIQWQHPILGTLPSEDFLPIAKESDLIFKINEWLLTKIATQYHDWENHNASIANITTHIDLCTDSFLKDASKYRLDNFGKSLKNRNIIFSLNHDALAECYKNPDNVLKNFQPDSMNLEIYNFGTTPFCLNFIQSLPVRYLNIAKSLVHQIGMDNKHDRTIKTIIGIANCLEIKVIADGVTAQRQLTFLKENGCHLASGNFFSQPLTAAEIIDLL